MSRYLTLQIPKTGHEAFWRVGRMRTRSSEFTTSAAFSKVEAHSLLGRVPLERASFVAVSEVNHGRRTVGDYERLRLRLSSVSLAAFLSAIFRSREKQSSA